MNKRLSTENYKRKIRADLEKKYGFADPILVSDMGKRYAAARLSERLGRNTEFNVYTGDPGCRSCKKDFKDLIDKHAGQTCYIIGKGPSVDKWTKDGSPIDENSITMGINNIGDYIKCDYVVCGHPEIINPLDGSYVLFTTKNDNKAEFQKNGWRYFPHKDDPSRKMERLTLTKEKLAKTGEFYSASSSVQHAIHIAWLMGCKDIVLIGIDGGSGYSDLIEKQKPDTATKYKMLRTDTEAELNILFNGNWKDYVKPMKRKPQKKKKRQ